MISGCTAWRPIWGFEPELYLLRAAQKRKGIVPKAQNGKGNETPKPYMESDQVVGNRLLFSFLGRARILAGPGWRPRRLEWGGGGSLWAQTNGLETSAAPGFSPVSGQQHQANTSLTAAGRLNQEKRRWLFERLPYAWPQTRKCPSHAYSYSFRYLLEVWSVPP